MLSSGNENASRVHQAGGITHPLYVFPTRWDPGIVEIGAGKSYGIEQEFLMEIVEHWLPNASNTLFEAFRKSLGMPLIAIAVLALESGRRGHRSLWLLRLRPATCLSVLRTCASGRLTL